MNIFRFMDCMDTPLLVMVIVFLDPQVQVDHRQELRTIAINKLNRIQTYSKKIFYDSNGNATCMSELKVHRELNHTRTLGTFAGQDSILALSRYFGTIILRSVGGKT